MKQKEYKAVYEFGSGKFIGWVGIFIKRLYDPTGKNIGYYTDRYVFFLNGTPMGEFINQCILRPLTNTESLSGPAKIPARKLNLDDLNLQDLNQS